MRTKNDMWQVMINRRHVATVHIPGSDEDWNLITRHRELIAEADPEARVTLSSEANAQGRLI
jgi:hypothetical protein